MRTILDLFRGAGLAVTIACLSLAVASVANASVGVAPATHDRELAVLARGVEGWLVAILDNAGLNPVSIPVGGEDGLSAAAAAGLDLALISRLEADRGTVEVHLALFAPATGQLIEARSAKQPLEFIGAACSEALIGLGGSLGIAPEIVTAPALGDLTSTSRALADLEQGRLHDAFHAVQGKLSPVAMATREAIVARARRAGDPVTERARLLAAVGDDLTAWGLVGSKATLALREQQPDLDLLLAAGEIQLARENPRQALRFLEVAAEHAPDSPDVQIALARTRIAQNDIASARPLLVRAAALDPDDTRALDLLIEIDQGEPSAVAAHKLEAASRLTARLDADPARRHLADTPTLDAASAASAAVRLGTLEARLGHHDEAIAAYQRAVEAGADGASALVGLGRSQHAQGNHGAAEQTLRRAIELEPENGAALIALGSVLNETDRASEAVPLLRRARVIQPDDPQTTLSLARSLRLTGEYDEAIEVLATGGDAADVERLREQARIQQAAGDLEGADATLLRAVRLVPDDSAVRVQRAQVLEASGNAAEAESERELAARVSGEASQDAEFDEDVVRRVDFDGIASSYANGFAGASNTSIAVLGLREPNDWKSWLRRLTRPREPSHAAVEQGLVDALAVRFGNVVPIGGDLGALDSHVDRLYDFESRSSLSVELIGAANTVIGSDGIFLSRLVTHPGDRRDLDCAPGTFAVETRLLLGADPEYVDILAATDCIEAGLDAYASWNIEAFAVYILLAIFVVFPIVRGWGTIVVRIHLPAKTKGFFSVHVTTKPDQVARDVIDKKTGREKIRAKRRLDLLRRFSRHMVGAETRFGWIPARSGEYTITVGGPLLDARGEQVVGFFLEEQQARVRRGGVTELTYDFRPKECAVEVKVAMHGRPAEEARVAVAGDPSSLRYAREGVAFIYVGKGEYTILVGTKDSVGEFRVLVEKLDAAVPLHVDLADSAVVFRDCAEAVEPYLQGDLASAAEALERAGNDAAQVVRAELYERAGRSSDAAEALESVGNLGHAAELRAADADHAGSAALFEQAGDFARAGAAYREAGQWGDAARCFEEIYDYGNALECWRELGDTERELDLLEKLGEYQDAAEIARESGDLDRAIRNLQQVDQRHPNYRHVCRVIAEIVSERGDHDLAVAKFEEALGADGLQSASLDVLESYASILERAGKRDAAISTYETIQRRDVARTDLSTRIQDLRAESEAATQAVPATSAAPLESRYELIDEIGRGGMGVVYKARDKRLGRIVALKRLPDNLREHPTAVELFEREARAAAALNHQNIVTLFDAGEEGGAYFITMELLQGRALNEILVQNRRISVRDTARLGIQIAAGLHYAHESRIVHRDIKTANLFFTKDQVVKIMDFGIAKSLEEVRRSTTVVGGTPYYMAPEQAKGQGVDHRADLYAFGVTLYQLVTGALPFTDGDVTYLHAHEPPPDPRELQVDIPAELAELVLWMMAKAPEERPDSAAQVSERLRAILAGLG